AEFFSKVLSSTREDVGNFQCNGSMPLAIFAKKPPLAIAEVLVEHIDAEDIFAKLEVANPGFINITLAPKFLADTTNRFLNS
ncbi:arginine--tRNA ligase, partial [Francisella tularensis subsp. holarctica]|nr:arginine--tRNA ligase [Francisella tularensis subsp. holarctica]